MQPVLHVHAEAAEEKHHVDLGIYVEDSDASVVIVIILIIIPRSGINPAPAAVKERDLNETKARTDDRGTRRC